MRGERSQQCWLPIADTVDHQGTVVLSRGEQGQHRRPLRAATKGRRSQQRRSKLLVRNEFGHIRLPRNDSRSPVAAVVLIPPSRPRLAGSAHRCRWRWRASVWGWPIGRRWTPSPPPVARRRPRASEGSRPAHRPSAGPDDPAEQARDRGPVRSSPGASAPGLSRPQAGIMPPRRANPLHKGAQRRL